MSYIVKDLLLGDYYIKLLNAFNNLCVKENKNVVSNGGSSYVHLQIPIGDKREIHIHVDDHTIKYRFIRFIHEENTRIEIVLYANVGIRIDTLEDLHLIYLKMFFINHLKYNPERIQMEPIPVIYNYNQTNKLLHENFSVLYSYLIDKKAL